MQFDRVGRGFGRTSVAAFWVVLTLATAVGGLTLLFLGMRSVMEVGGACADGGPYVSAQPCPDGVPLAVLGGIFGGVIAFLAYAWVCFNYGIPGLWWLAWPALFLSLGWNFLEFGLDSPGDGGLEWGWLFCAVLFFLMGGVPLLIGLQAIVGTMFGRRPAAPSPGGAQTVSDLKTLASALRASRGAPASAASVASAVMERKTATEDDLVRALERLAALRARGALTEAEFAEAKRQLLEDDE